MTATHDLDRQLGAWLEERATPTPPDGLLERSLARVDATRQRPGWLIKDGWILPGQLKRQRSLTTMPQPSTTPSTRLGRRPTLAILAAAALLVAALVGGAIAVGAGLTRHSAVVPPAPDASPAATPPPSFGETSPSPTAKATPTPPGSAMWTATGSMVETRFGETATLLPNGNVLVAGGRSNGCCHGFSRATAELYDPSTGRWTLTGSMHEARQGHAAVRLANGDVLVLGGDASGGGGVPRLLSSAEVYDPSTGTWTDSGRLTMARMSATATLLPDGRILVAGGVSSRANGPERSAEVYDPVTGTWAKTAAMSVARNGHTATLLSDGHVLVVGGGCCNQAARASAELYDPASGTWARTGALGSARVYHTAVLLADGKLLVYGGDNRSDHPAVTTAELYDPVTGVWVATGSPRSPGNVFETQGSGLVGRLSDGRIFAAAFGGAGELYDPASGSWTAVGGLSGDTYTYVHTSTLLADGRVLVTTEQFPAAGGGPIPAAALLDPSGKP